MNRRKDGVVYCEEMQISPVRGANGETISYIAIKRDVTEKRAAQQAQRFLAAIVEGSEHAILAFSRAGIVLTWNHGAEAVFGYAAGEAIGRHISMVAPAEEQPRLALFAEQTFKGSALAKYEGFGVRKDGRRIYLGLTACLMRSPAGEEPAISVILRDITERRETEKVLRESEGRFRLMADSCPTPIWVSNAVGRVEFVNRAYRKLLGIAGEGLEGFDRQLAFHPDDAPHYFAAFYRAVAERSAFRGEGRVRRADGEWRWFASYAEPRLSANGEFLGHGGISLDVTERKQAEQAIHDAREFAQATIDTLSSHVCVLDEAGTIIAVNHAWTAFADANRKVLPDGSVLDSVGRGGCCGEGVNYLAMCEQLTGPGSAEGAEFAAGIRSVLASENQRYTLEYACHSLDERRWFVGKVTRFRSAGLRRILIEHVNITELKLAQEISLKAMQSAEAANLAKSRFLASMSHEIRTPMNAILGMADMLWESKLDAEQRQYLEVFRRAGASLLMLINNILDLSKIEAGSLQLERVAFDLEEVVNHAMELTAVRARQKGIALMARFAPGVATALAGDPTRLRQILINLLGNAVKFTEAGEVVLEIRNHAGGKPGEMEFAVTDTGVGIPPEKLENIFDDFVQADAATTRNYGGTGLGLGISRRLVESMGGRLTAANSAGVGSVFRFNVPFGLASQGCPTVPTAAADLNGRRVLTIDDNRTSGLILRETLQGWGLKCDVFESLTDAAAHLSEAKPGDQPYALAVVDNCPDRVDGFAAAAQIRRIAGRLPIVMLTCDVRPEDGHRRLGAGLSGYAVKPVPRAHLWRLVCAAIGFEIVQPAGALVPKNKETAKPARLLIVEDSPDNQLLIQAYLKGSPYGLTFEKNGRAGVERFAAADFDLVLMDVMMPEMDGLEATRAIRALELARGAPPIPIVALTANASLQDIEKSAEAGCNAQVSKPISKAELLAAIEKYRRQTGPEEMAQAEIWRRA
jgi:PAS domain S-box-containing protein